MTLAILTILLQQTADATSISGGSLTFYGVSGVGVVGTIYLISNNVIKILAKLTLISKKIDDLTVTDEKKEAMETQKKEKIEELHSILTEKNDNGQKLIHAPYFFLKEFAAIQTEISKEAAITQKEMSKSISELVAIHKEQSKFQETIINKLASS